MSLSPSVDHAVVGASDLEAAAAFYGAFGFDVLRRGEVAADAASALYGLTEPTKEIVLGVPGATGGMIRLVATPLARPTHDAFSRGGHALDLYTTDIEASVALAKAQGAVVGPVADYTFGPVHLTQAQAMAPDEVPLVFVGIDHRLPSVLDAQPDRLHSDLHSLVASVDGIDAETAFWTDAVQLDMQSAFPIDVPAVSDFMMLPRHVPVRMSVLRGPAAAPPRFELLEFQGAEGPYHPGRPLVPGSIAAGLRVANLSAVLDRLVSAGAEAGPMTIAPALMGDGNEPAAYVRSPGGVDIEIRGPVE
jgi:catechol 2,3-dioxygenase-like lactoylglutathione lyase family enzyme